MRNGNAHETLQKTMELGYDTSVLTRDALARTQLNVFVIMITSIVFLGACIFLPILRTVDNMADALMVNFATMPVKLRQALLEQSAERVRELKRSYANADDDEDDTDDDVDLAMGVTAAGGANAGTAAGASADGAPAAGATGAHNGATAAAGAVGPPPVTVEVATGADAMNWSDLADGGKARRARAAKKAASLAATSNAAALASHSSGSDSDGSTASRTMSKMWGMLTTRSTKLSRKGNGKAYRKSSTSFLYLLVRFGAPLLALILLFTIIYATFLQALDRAMVLNSVSAAANTRASCARQAVTELRKLTMLTTDSAYIRNSYWFTMDAIDCVLFNNRLLAFGACSSACEGKVG
jgi:hypothetical protein